MSREPDTKRSSPDSADVRDYILEKLGELAAMAENSTLDGVAERIQSVADLEGLESGAPPRRAKPRPPR